MTATSITKDQREQDNTGAVVALKRLDYPLANIRQALPPLTGKIQRVVAEEVGLCRRSVGKYLDGTRCNPVSQVKIARAYGVDPVEMFPELLTQEDEAA